ncbi:MAG: RidA family protein [Acidaminococcus sp.]|nr:RidA family protein [Acidaminococcus sp.]MCI2101111.1 RidA family protein [Acidaminococcus sp.]MCI2115508.1 RidA family protein [Acidaminococcus sp.]MCI2117640.1 RidA family protein [Acidaminococcus sp.]
MKKELATKKAPSAIGPYSQGIEATGTTVYVSGQIPIDPATGEFAGKDIVTQTKQSLTNVKNILAEAGCTMDDVVKTTVLLADIKDFGAMNEVYGTFFKGVCPARACFQVAALPKGALVEIEAFAVK